MQYSKTPISIQEQVKKLQERGLSIDDEEIATHYLSNISFYRFRAYTYPFQDNINQNHLFIKKVSFEEIIQLYIFDRHLRLLLFNAIEKIEISIRTQIIYQFSMNYGSHWHSNPSLFNDLHLFNNDMDSLQKEINRSKELFINHYNSKYTNPSLPPSWMSLEITSFGLLSKIFANLKNDSSKNEVVKHFGLKGVDILENWIRCFSLLRNICAHHGRVWNRRMTKITLPKKPVHLYIENKNILQYKVYAYIVQLQYILNIISPGNDFKNNLTKLIQTCPLVQEKEMGFPNDWQSEKFWK